MEAQIDALATYAQDSVFNTVPDTVITKKGTAFRVHTTLDYRLPLNFDIPIAGTGSSWVRFQIPALKKRNWSLSSRPQRVESVHFQICLGQWELTLRQKGVVKIDRAKKIRKECLKRPNLAHPFEDIL